MYCRNIIYELCGNHDYNETIPKIVEIGYYENTTTDQI
jgi:hypothetical protein